MAEAGGPPQGGPGLVGRGLLFFFFLASLLARAGRDRRSSAWLAVFFVGIHAYLLFVWRGGGARRKGRGGQRRGRDSGRGANATTSATGWGCTPSPNLTKVARATRGCANDAVLVTG